MRRSPAEAVTEFEELRRLLLSREREQLRELRERVSDKERRSRDVAAILPEAVKMSPERGDELASALRPAVEHSVRESIEKHPETLSMRFTRSSGQSLGARSPKVSGDYCNRSTNRSNTLFPGRD